MTPLFKRRWLPNADGTDGTTALTDSNTVFVHTYQGDDLTGDGTRAKPFKTFNKAIQTGKPYIVFRGVVNEYFQTYMPIIGDDNNQIIATKDFSPYFVRQLYCLTLPNSIMSCNYQVGFFSVIFSNPALIYVNTQMDGGMNESYNLFLGTNTYSYIDHESHWTNQCTFNNQTGITARDLNALFFGTINFNTTNMCSNPYMFRNTVFSTGCIFQYNGVTLSPVWTNDSIANVQILINALIAAGMSSTIANWIFYIDSFNNQTCKIIWEQRNGGTHPNIFNKYDASGNVLDFTLNPDPTNEALFASTTGGYVGCFKAATPINSTAPDTLQSVINVNADGSDDTAAGTLVVQNADDSITFNTSSTQTWNRIKSATTITVPQNKKFLGLNVMSTDGSPFGYYFGKFQNIIDPTALTPASTLLANTWYKVCNAVVGTYQAISWNNTQYLPDYFFFTGSGPTSFTLAHSDSGTVVKKVLADPLESMDVHPYDNLTTPSTFPIFSAPLMENCNMLFYKAGNSYGKNAGTPVLFSDTQVAAISDKITYYAAYAVTNADWEFVQLASDTTNYYYAPPALTYLRIEINAHFSLDYDQ